MRDIRPAKPNKGLKLPPLNKGEYEDLELYEASAAAKAEAIRSREERKKRSNIRSLEKKISDSQRSSLKGASVPIAKVVVTDRAKRKEDKRLPRRVVDKKKEERPLFMQAAAQKPGKVKVGRNERKVVLVFVSLVLLAVGIAGLIFLPTAKISLRLRTAPLLLDEELVIGAAGSGGDNVVPGTSFFRELTITGSTKVKTTQMVGSKSRGMVEIVNKTSQEQKIKERSRLETKDGRLFYMLKHVFVPPNSRTRVEVEAAEEGAEGNIEPQKLTFPALDKSAADILYAEVKQPLTGGSGEEIAVVGEKDIDAAKKEAEQKAKEQVKQQIGNELPEGWVLLDESWNLVISDFSSNGQVGDKMPVIDYQARMTARVMGYEKTKFEEIMKNKLEERLDKGFMLFPGPISYTQSIKSVNWDQSTATIGVRVTHTTVPRISIDTLKEKLAGRSGDEARQYLEGLPGARAASIKLWPFWVRSIPRVERRIEIDLQSEKKI